MRNGVDTRDLIGLEAATSQLPLIGFTVLWRLEGIRVSHPDLEQALQSAGFEKYLPDPPTRRVALRRALAEWIKSVLAVRRRDLRLPLAYPLLGLSSAFAKPKKDFFSFFTTRCRKNTLNWCPDLQPCPLRHLPREALCVVRQQQVRLRLRL